MSDNHLAVVPRLLLLLLVATAWPSALAAQSVCLPAPRLLTTMPMGGKAGTTVDVAITGEHLEDLDELRFSHPKIQATQKLAADGTPVANQYTVTIAADCPEGIHEARIMTRLGISSSRVFSVGALTETSSTTPNTKLETAMPLELNSICNGKMTSKAVDYYTVAAKQGERLLVSCAAQGIDSKLKPVLIVADEQGNDLRVERRGGAIDFMPEADGQYVIKVHDLTFSGGPYHFYRLAVQQISTDAVAPQFAATRNVNAFSWPPANLSDDKLASEQEPNNTAEQVQSITLPCDISGSFYPAADVDAFEFTAKKGEVWWVEVASERLGLPTDPSIVVQRVKGTGSEAELVDLVELTDIPSPIKVSSNGYSYDGPCYNAGSADINGKVEIPEDGVYRLQLTDLFGGTRNDPRNVYRLIIRQAQPDFAVVGWALHMNLRNGDRNALSKPIALRGGATMAMEVVAIRRDGFAGPIELAVDNLPPGVSASGLTIPAGKSRGILLFTAEENAPRGLTSAQFVGKAEIDGIAVTRKGSMASMAWPVTNAWSEIPSPRLLADFPVSVGGAEVAPISIAAAQDQVWEVTAGQTLTIPLVHTRRCEFSGPSMSLKTFGHGFEGNAAFDLKLTEDSSEATLDLAKLKPAPGTYTIAFYGSAVAKYCEHPDAVAVAEVALQLAKKEAAEAAKPPTTAEPTTEEEKQAADVAAKEAAARLTAATAAVAAAEKQLQAATKKGAPKDIVDIVVSKPIEIRVVPAVEVTQK
ncbi:serine protease [Blastopirellula sp. J2-11]|uniref:serine protease n=1 Tax=Blastopirellula sp. J2-11 TaxID=2943192 RepID=UPI0021C56B52|nr:serine protease [Blastopirellula sp. J2-11]UUO08856.1 serine protease [Blastopirellula sp. J2-11]